MTGINVFNQVGYFLGIDLSGSMGEQITYGGQCMNKYQAVLLNAYAWAQILAQRNTNTYLSIAAFNHSLVAHHICPINETKGVFQNLATLMPTGGTDLSIPQACLDNDSQKYIANGIFPQQALLISDGWDKHILGGHLINNAQNLQKRIPTLSSIGIGDNPSLVNESMLRSISTPGQYRFCKTLIQLRSILISVTVTAYRRTTQ